MSHIFDRKTDSFFGTLSYAGYGLLLVGALTASSPWWWSGEVNQTQMLAVGVLLLVMGVLFKFTHHGFQLDFEQRRVREYLLMFGIKFGQWAPLPAFERVILTTNMIPQDHDHPGEEPALVKWYTVGLYSTGEEPAYELRTSHEHEALQTLELLSQRLQVPSENKLVS
ncbi:hypothetical protein GU926_09440 [Nibribacter ruber]|uniref:Uncharacterized protein n=1 Tax=Nibribacter ruber TaxID=2698458 RepID=A0A6P1NV96_9BACT|nr:hypothetical protein [Nibribacter ruber]QHL87647.1 hypothetical protein GU926_09440 [Nibribacter ruber]